MYIYTNMKFNSIIRNVDILSVCRQSTCGSTLLWCNAHAIKARHVKTQTPLANTMNGEHVVMKNDRSPEAKCFVFALQDQNPKNSAFQLLPSLHLYLDKTHFISYNLRDKTTRP